MSHRRAGMVWCATLALAGVALGGPAPAGAARLKGQVVGTPYVAGATSSAVPVLLSKESARAARLRSQVGVVVTPRARAVPSPDGPVLPGNLRIGDRLVLTASVPRAVRRAAYVRIVAQSLGVTARSTQLSTAELQALIEQTRAQLVTLSGRVDALSSSTQASLAALGARVDDLQAQLAALRRDLTSLQGQLAAMGTALDAAATDLRSRIDQVRSDLQPQIDALSTSVSSLAGELGSCSEAGTVLARLCALETAAAAADPAAVTALTDRVTQLSGALTTTVGSLTGLTLSGDLPASLSPAITSALTNLAGLQDTVSGLSGTVTTLSGSVGSLQTAMSGVQSQLGSVDATALQGQVDNLIADLGADPSGLNATAITTLQSQVGSLQSSVASMGAQLGSVDVPALSATVSGIQGDVSSIQTTLAGVCAAVNGQALPVLGTLPLVGDVTGMLTAQLTDACP